VARLPHAVVKLTVPETKPHYDRDNEQEFRRLVEQFLLSSGSGTGGLPSRRQVIFTTASLAPNAMSQSSVSFLAPAQHLLYISVNRACRLRFYAIAATQSSDASRAHTTAPQAGIGVLLDSIWLTVHTKYIAPPVLLYNGDSPAAFTIYYTVENLSATTGTVTVTATVVSAEA